jgi:F-type H+-transporting ATPase subunit b
MSNPVPVHAAPLTPVEAPAPVAPAQAAHATTQASTHAAAHEAPPEGLMGWLNHTNLVSFLVVAIGLAIVVNKLGLLNKVTDQRTKIIGELETLETQKKVAVAQLQEVQRRTENLSTEVDQIMKDAQVSAKAISDQMVATAHADVARLVERTKQRIEVEQRAAVHDLQSRLLQAALDEARDRLAQDMTKTDRKKSVEQFLDDLAANRLNH